MSLSQNHSDRFRCSVRLQIDLLRNGGQCVSRDLQVILAYFLVVKAWNTHEILCTLQNFKGSKVSICIWFLNFHACIHTCV